MVIVADNLYTITYVHGQLSDSGLKLCLDICKHLGVIFRSTIISTFLISKRQSASPVVVNEFHSLECSGNSIMA